MPRFLAVTTLGFVLAASASAGQVTIVAARDNTIYSDVPGNSNGAGTQLFAGPNTYGGIRRALLVFDVAQNVPAGSTITAVRLQVHLSTQSSGAEIMTIHRLLASWGEGASAAPFPEGQGTTALANDATWTQRFFGSSQPWTTPGGSFVAGASSSLSINGIATWTFPSTPALVADVQQMLDVPATDFGWILRGNEAVASTAKRFESRQSPSSTTWPRLVVDYAPACVAPTTFCTAGPNSTGSGGAQIGWTGSLSIAQNSFALTLSGTHAVARAALFYGPSQALLPFGDGARCIGGTIRRLGQLTTTAGTAVRALDFNTLPLANDVQASTAWYFQFVYRDTAAGASGFNLSNGLCVAFCP